MTVSSFPPVWATYCTSTLYNRSVSFPLRQNYVFTAAVWFLPGRHYQVLFFRLITAVVYCARQQQYAHTFFLRRPPFTIRNRGIFLKAQGRQRPAYLYSPGMYYETRMYIHVRNRNRCDTLRREVSYPLICLFLHLYLLKSYFL